MDTGRLDEAIRAHGLAPHRDAILATARPAIYLRLGAAGQGTPGESRVGGIPDLPDSMPWPMDPLHGRPRAFLLQIDLAALPAFADSLLPRHGMLYLFADQDTNDADQLVVYTGREPLRPRPPATDAPSVTDWYDGLVPHRLALVAGADLPRWASEDFYALARALGGADEEEALHQVGLAMSRGGIGRLLGHVSGIGHDPRENAYRVRGRGAWPDVDAAALAPWINLLELRSAEAVNLAFGPADYLQVLGHADDVRRGDFSRVYVNLEWG